MSHKDLKVVNRYSETFGHSVNQVLVVPAEFADVQREYPILLRRDGSGEYQAVALLGFERGENLFLNDGEWRAGYIPSIVARGPFLIGFQQLEVNGETRREPVIHVDLDDPRVGGSEGEPLFLPHGGNSAYLERIASTLDTIQRGMEISRAMFPAWESCGLITPVNLQVEVHRDAQYDLQGYYTLDAARLAALDGNRLESLNRAGFLQAAFLVCASLGNVRKLIELKRKRILAEMPG